MSEEVDAKDIDFCTSAMAKTQGKEHLSPKFSMRDHFPMSTWAYCSQP